MVLAAAGGPPAEVLLKSTHVKAHRSTADGKGLLLPIPVSSAQRSRAYGLLP